MPILQIAIIIKLLTLIIFTNPLVKSNHLICITPFFLFQIMSAILTAMTILLYHNNSFCETYKTRIIKGFLIKTIRIKKPCRKKTGHHIRCPALFRGIWVPGTLFRVPVTFDPKVTGTQGYFYLNGFSAGYSCDAGWL